MKVVFHMQGAHTGFSLDAESINDEAVLGEFARLHAASGVVELRRIDAALGRPGSVCGLGFCLAATDPLRGGLRSLYQMPKAPWQDLLQRAREIHECYAALKQAGPAQAESAARDKPACPPHDLDQRTETCRRCQRTFLEIANDPLRPHAPPPRATVTAREILQRLAESHTPCGPLYIPADPLRVIADLAAAVRALAESLKGGAR